MNELLQRIANNLILKSCVLNNVGLYYGKMGLILFFAHYFRYTGKSVYDDFAGELLDELCEELYEQLPENFGFGLCGIGWGIEYLIENQFVEPDSNEILFELDRKIQERDIRKITDLSVETGLAGISYYLEKRLLNAAKNKKETAFDHLYISEWKVVKKEITIPSDKTILLSAIGVFSENKDFMKEHLGLHGGCAGYGLKLLLA